CQQGDTLPWTF
nr:immunoglobulin light chain junction region [Mus musculus]NSM01668.1 immunoglobulin light chain junction region [Mus musculus]